MSLRDEIKKEKLVDAEQNCSLLKDQMSGAKMLARDELGKERKSVGNFTHCGSTGELQQ